MNHVQRVLSIAQQLADEHIGPPSPAYFEITEGRKDWVQNGVTRKYSWCGDFVTYVLERAKATTLRQFMNRISINGKWQVGKNISMLVEGARSVGAARAGRDAYTTAVAGARGWIAVLDVANGGHVCFLKEALNAERYITLDGNSIGGTTQERIRTFSQSKILWLLDIDAWFADEVEDPTTPPVNRGRVDDPGWLKALGNIAADAMGAPNEATTDDIYKEVFDVDDSQFNEYEQSIASMVGAVTGTKIIG